MLQGDTCRASESQNQPDEARLLRRGSRYRRCFTHIQAMLIDITLHMQMHDIKGYTQVRRHDLLRNMTWVQRIT